MPQSTFTPEQKRWLTEKYKIFLVHCDRKTPGLFFPALYEEYFTLWPPPVLAVEGVQGPRNNSAIANAKARTTEEHNGGINGQGSSAGLNLTVGPPKRKAPVQTYVKYNWATKVKPEVIKLWAPTPEADLFGEIDNGEDQVAWEAMMPMEKNIPLWFKMKVGRELYEAESDEVKAQIDQLRDRDMEDAVAAQAEPLQLSFLHGSWTVHRDNSPWVMGHATLYNVLYNP
ncbi:hypothetical protein BJ322DRAFT_1113652 [Thelephora terrestris]|uniref:Uncharacterized protein n=1 Tax=Thelephora terrestris TaxID=56493 RepID=A0A9P6H4K8_9AGAM|nr:hypothetical protein BJ322DRAFT_1113652 [Thelephora terrestris]